MTEPDGVLQLRRGDLTIWFSDDAFKSWQAPTSGRPGGQHVYANIAIETALTIRMVFHLPLRLTEGFLRSLANMLDVEIPIPDSTGLRIHVGNLRKTPKRRDWRRLHLAVDVNTGEIVASDLTDRRTHDCTLVGPLLGQIPKPLASLSADGAYDAAGVYEAAQSKGEGRTIRELGRREWYKRSGFCKRSMVENTVYRF